MFNYPLRQTRTYTSIKNNSAQIRDERRKPNLRTKVYVVPEGSGETDDLWTFSSPEFMNGFGAIEGSEIWFANGLDGETDMGGAYDLVTGSPVSGTIAFMMPNRWAFATPFAVTFPVELDTDVWSIAVQKIDPLDPSAAGGETPVRIYWPIVADPIL